MKILILGHNGMLGNVIYSYFKDKYDVYVCYLRWDSNEFKQIVESIKVDFIINCIGAIPQKIYKIENYQNLNVDLPIFLESTGKKIIHPSTDCEFNGNLEYPLKYKKTDKRDAYDDYGKSKAKISQMIEEEFHNTKIIRTSIVGHELNSNKSLLDWFLNIDENKEVNGYINHHWNGITSLLWAEIAEKILLDWKNYSTIIQVGINGINKYELLKTFQKIYNKSLKINKFNTPVTVNKMLESDFEIPTIEEQLIKLKDYYKK